MATLRHWEPVLTVHTTVILLSLGDIIGGLVFGPIPTWGEFLGVLSIQPSLLLLVHVLAYRFYRFSDIETLDYQKPFAAKKPSEKHPLLLYLILSFALLSFAALLQLPNSLRRGSFDTFGFILPSVLIALSFLLDWLINKFKAIRLLFP